MDPNQEDGQTVTFHLIKSPGYQTLRVDGAIGSMTPSGLALSFYVERGPLPQTVTHEIDENGALGKVVSATGKKGIIREIQTGIVIDVGSARDLIKELEKLLPNPKVETE